ncbi:MAG: type VI secretion system baseplate subunit TssE [Pseudomonadales bacterium]
MIFWQAFMRGDGPVAQSPLVAAIEQQLVTLFSSEAPLTLIAKQYREVQRSNLCFGLDNLQSVSSQMDSASFARQLEHWIKLYEPRLSAVNVEVRPKDERRNRIEFSVQAQVVSEGQTHELQFSSRMNLTSQLAELEENSFV